MWILKSSSPLCCKTQLHVLQITSNLNYDSSRTLTPLPVSDLENLRCLTFVALCMAAARRSNKYSGLWNVMPCYLANNTDLPPRMLYVAQLVNTVKFCLWQVQGSSRDGVPRMWLCDKVCWSCQGLTWSGPIHQGLVLTTVTSVDNPIMRPCSLIAVPELATRRTMIEMLPLSDEKQCPSPQDKRHDNGNSMPVKHKYTTFL